MKITTIRPAPYNKTNQHFITINGPSITQAQHLEDPNYNICFHITTHNPPNQYNQYLIINNKAYTFTYSEKTKGHATYALHPTPKNNQHKNIIKQFKKLITEQYT